MQEVDTGRGKTLDDLGEVLQFTRGYLLGDDDVVDVAVEGQLQHVVELFALETGLAQESLDRIVGERGRQPDAGQHPGGVRRSDGSGLDGRQVEPGPPHLVVGMAQAAIDIGRRELEVAQVDPELGEWQVERDAERHLRARVGEGGVDVAVDDLAQVRLDHLVDDRQVGHEGVGVGARHRQRPQVRPTVLQVERVRGLPRVDEDRARDIGLDEVHQIGEVGRWAEHRAAVRAVTEVLRAEQVAVAVDAAQVVDQVRGHVGDGQLVEEAARRVVDGPEGMGGDERRLLGAGVHRARLPARQPAGLDELLL